MQKALLVASSVLTACVQHAGAPSGVSGAELGVAPPDFNPSHACVDWVGSTADPAAREHDAFPERFSGGCFARVHYDGGRVWVDGAASGCGYPDAGTLGALERRASEEEVAARSWSSLESQPLELACELPPEARRAAATANAKTLRSLAHTLSSDPPARLYPYAAVGTFGFGEGAQDASVVLHFRPGQACVPMGAPDLRLLSVNVARARRAAEAFHAGAAPVVIVSGGAVHSSAFEAFFLTHLLVCEFGVPADRVLVDPCADHTHTNVRNTGALVAAIGGRFAYLVTDDGIQAAYLEEWTAFDLLGGSIDQRALRDFGYLIGAWRRASVGMRAGYWYTPFRFWATPGRTSALSCAGDAAPSRDEGGY